MIYIVTYSEVQHAFVSQFIGLAQQYRQASGDEEANAEMTVLQEMYRPNRFVVLEEWESEPAFLAHQHLEHVVRFQSGLKDIYNSPSDQRVHNGFAVGPRQFTGPAHLFVVTHVDVPPPRKDETEALLRSAAEQSRGDLGNTRYDVFQQITRPNHFTVLSVWNDEASLASHQTAPRTRTFRETLGPMLGALYDERLYKPL
jgi:quinol monooxygenase YgiN